MDLFWLAVFAVLLFGGAAFLYGRAGDPDLLDEAKRHRGRRFRG
jgi:hypothetical protein